MSRLSAENEVIVVSGEGPGPHDVYVSAFSGALAETAGISVVELRPNDVDEAAWDRRRAFRPQRTGIVGRLSHAVAREVATVRHGLDAGRGSVVHVQDFGPLTFLALGILRRFGRRTSATVHNAVPHENSRGLLTKVGWWLDRAACGQLDFAVVHTDALGQMLRVDLDPRCKVLVAAHPVWQFAALSPVEAGARTTVLVFGVLRHGKGVDRLPDIARALPREHFVIAGSPNEDPEYASRVAALCAPVANIELRLEHLSDEDVRHMFAAAKIVLMPYTGFAAQSGVLHLAAAFLRPVVVTPVGALVATVREHGLGFCARSSDPSDIIETLDTALRAVGDDAWVAAYREQVDVFARKATWQAHVEALLDAWRQP